MQRVGTTLATYQVVYLYRGRHSIVERSKTWKTKKTTVTYCSILPSRDVRTAYVISGI
jgi:hypothetical protein